MTVTSAGIRFPGASWNTTAAMMGRAPEDQQFRAARFHTFAGGKAPADEYRMTCDDYSVPEYNCLNPRHAPNTIRRLYQTGWAQRQFGPGGEFRGPGIAIGKWIPFNPNWKRPPGNDGLVNVRNLPEIVWKTQKQWEADKKIDPKSPQYTFDYSSTDDPVTTRFMGIFAAYEGEFNGHDWPFGPNTQNGFYDTAPENKLICAAITITTGHYAAGWRDRIGHERGSGMPKMFGRIEGQEVCDHALTSVPTALPHALNVTIVNSMWRPYLDPKTKKPSTDTIGRAGVDFVGPAERAERLEGFLQLHSPGITSDADPTHQTLHGTRVALKPEYDVEMAVELRRLSLNKYYKTAYTRNSPIIKLLFCLMLTDQVMGEIADETGNFGKHSESDYLATDLATTPAWSRLGVMTSTRQHAIYLRSGIYKAEDWYLVNSTLPGM